MSPQRLSIQLFGSFLVCVGEREIDDAAWQRRHARQLVKLLALNPRHRLQREVLAEYLWPESPPDKSAKNLNKMLFMARRALEPSLKNGSDSCFLHRVGDVIELSCHAGMNIDIDEFESAAIDALNQDALAPLLQSAKLHTQELLIDEPYDQIIVQRREKLSRLHHQLLQKLAHIANREGQTEHAISAMQELLDSDGLNEDYHRQLMQYYADSNQRAKAIDQYHYCQSLLQKELGQAPSAETTDLLHTISDTGRISVSDIAHTQKKPITSPGVTEETDADALAVLPFENASGADEVEYLCDGIAENLTASLSRLPSQRVLARSTMLRYKNQQVQPLQLRNELSVGRVVCGRLASLKNRIRVWIEVLDTTDGVIQWAQHYDRQMQDIVALQTQIAEDVLNWFHAELQSESHPGTPDLNTDNSGAYHDYLKGRYHWNKRSSESLESARQFFQAAIDQDPVYGLAYAGLADTYNVMSLYSTASPHDTMPKARAAAKHALTIDPQLAEAHTSLGYCLVSYDWLWHEAESAFKRALSINPNYATARQWYHKLLVATGRFEQAQAQIEQAKKLDPLSVMIRTEEAWGLYHAHQFQKAVTQLETVLQEDPQFALARCLLGLAQIQLSNFDHAIENLNEAGQKGHKPFTLQLGALGYAYCRNNQISDANTILHMIDQLDTGSGGAAYARALINIGIGDFDTALTDLENAFSARFDRIIFLMVDPIFKPLHSQSRLHAMTRQLDLEPLLA